MIAKDLATWWAREDVGGMNGPPKKKLVSLPPVPKTVPRGNAYQSSRADWKAWSPIFFELQEPQRYQYEVRAAADGKSAEIIARGDLNGDGKTSLFKLAVKVDGDVLRVAPSIYEVDPNE